VHQFTQKIRNATSGAFSSFIYPSFSISDFNAAQNKSSINMQYTIDGIELKFSNIYDTYSNAIKLDDGINNSASFESLLEKNQGLLPIVLYYSTNRLITITNPKIKYSTTPFYDLIASEFFDYTSILAWFQEKDNQEARIGRNTKNTDFRLPELEVLRKALSLMLQGEYSEPNFDDNTGEMTVKQKETGIDVPVSKLSQGFLSSLLLVFDMARRMFLANGHRDFKDNTNYLHTPSIVLIDEIELHLHPSWQQKIIATLRKIFPKTQFILTTHSPQVLTTIQSQHILVLDGKIAKRPETPTYARQAQEVLEYIFDVSPRPETKVSRLLEQYRNLVTAGEGNTPQALALNEELNYWLADDPVFLATEMRVNRYELLAKYKNAQNKQNP
jgi:predicted ATP-binding protein involved in virulence